MRRVSRLQTFIVTYLVTISFFESFTAARSSQAVSTVHRGSRIAGNHAESPGGVAMPNILVVDDNADTRDLMKAMLEVEGLKVLVAVDGMDGIEQARRESPALIITDIAMPRLNGIEMIEQLRAMPEFINAPILAITSYGIEGAMEARIAGASRALARPSQNHLLVAFALDLLKMAAGESRAAEVLN
jgi:CheY-like chemotaxis protein